MKQRYGRNAAKITSCATLTVALTVTLSLGAATTAHADYYSGGMPSRSFNVKAVGINDTWVGFLDRGRSNWNGSGAGTNIGRKSSAKATFTAGRYNESWYGLYSPSGLRPINRIFAIKVNAKRLAEKSGSKMTEWCRSTTTHELGHALSLDDNPNTTKASLMKHNRNRATVQAPLSYDVSEVKRIYK
ncbi:hypothetical protein ACMZ5F_22875 [Streptomyces rhizosphaericola]|uniref:hypothetical protein n=1 Tax=Streptomyces TaxID=1883 RepID=UPI001E3D4F02|nr:MULTISPECIES: hypothetical protein [unclassified Streptomyces]